MAYEAFNGDKSNSIRIEGDTYLVSALQSLAPTIGRKYLKGAIDKAVKPMQAALLANTPMGPTGNLRAAVGANSVYYKSSGVAFGVVGYKRAVSLETGDQNGYHSHLVEFGTADRVPKKAPFLSSYGIKDMRPAGWAGRWPMVARKVRGARALHPLGNAFAATAGQCRDILVREMEIGLEKGLAEQARKGL